MMTVDIHFYDHRPPLAVYARAKPTVIELPSEQVAKVCQHPEYLACTYLDAPAGPLVILPSDVSAGEQQRLRDHEMRHVRCMCDWHGDRETR